jgi:hypothetical protein
MIFGLITGLLATVAGLERHGLNAGGEIALHMLAQQSSHPKSAHRRPHQAMRYQIVSFTDPAINRRVFLKIAGLPETRRRALREVAQDPDLQREILAMIAKQATLRNKLISVNWQTIPDFDGFF